MASLAMKGALRLPQAGPHLYGPVALQHFGYASEVTPRELNTASMKRGRGGRSSFSGDVVTVFGANGFIGRAVSNRLGKNGSQMIFPYRGEHYKMMKMKTVGDLGQVLFTPFELRDDDSIRRAVAHSNIVINLTGRGFETRNFRYEDVNIDGPARIARICQEMGVERLVHMSHINAREEPEAIFLSGGSKFLATKWQGEQAVRAEFPGATIFRASDVYGQGDSFLHYYFSKFRRSRQGALSLYAKGELTAKQPIFMSDLASGIINSLHDPSAVGETYEAMGPQRMTQADLLTYCFDCATRNKEEGNFDIKELMFDPRTLVKHYIMGKMGKMGNHTVFVSASLDRLERDSVSDTSEGLPDMAEALGVKLTRLEQKVPYIASAWDQYAYYYYETVAEKPVPRPPVLLSAGEERALHGRRENLGHLALLPPGLL